MHAIREVEYLVPASATSDISGTSELSTRGRSLSARGRGARGGRATDRETSTENSGRGCDRDRGCGRRCLSANLVRNSARSPLQDLSNQASFAAPDPPLKKTVMIDAWERLIVFKKNMVSTLSSISKHSSHEELLTRLRGHSGRIVKVKRSMSALIHTHQKQGTIILKQKRARSSR